MNVRYLEVAMTALCRKPSFTLVNCLPESGTSRQEDDLFPVPRFIASGAPKRNLANGGYVPGAECQEGRCNLPVVGQTGHRPQAIRAAAMWQLTTIDKEC